MASTCAATVQPVSLSREAMSPLNGDLAGDHFKRQAFGNYVGLSRSSDSCASFPKVTDRVKSQRLQIRAMATQKVGTQGGGKPRFGTQFFTQNDDNREEEEPAKRGGALVLIPSPFAGLQLFGRRQADSNTVFVSSATGQTGARIVLELLHDGFRVRAGVQDLREAQKLAELAAQYGLITSQEAKRLNAVEFSFDDAELTAKAIGNASKVVVTVGSGELGATGKVTYKDAARVVTAAELAKVSNVVLVSPVDSAIALSEGPVGFFAKFFSFFGGFGKKDSVSFEELLERVVDSNLKYTVIQTAQSEGVSDTFGGTSSVVIAPEGSAMQGKVSKLQVATVVSTALSNVGASENKIFEVVGSSEATTAPVVDLLSKIPQDGRREALAEAKAKAEAEEEAQRVAEEARVALETAQQLEEEARKLGAEEARAAAAAEKARARAEAVNASVSELSEGLKEAGGEVAEKPRLPFSFGGVPSAEPTESTESGNGASVGGFSLGGLASRLSKKSEEREETAEPPKPSRSIRRGRDPKPAPKPEPLPPAPVSEKPGKKGGLFAQDTVFVDSLDVGDF